ncbi:MAG: serine esterase [Acidimicrobiaceae bacterium]|nr:serine esterase [Acidimicrobiaceae bacterium]
MTTPTVLWSGSTDQRDPLVVLLHGRGSNELEINSLAAPLSQHYALAALRGPVVLGPEQFTWFENRGIGRPVPESLRSSIDWFRGWLDGVAATRPVALVGFSGGTAFAAGLVLDDPVRFAGAALLYGTIPFDAGVPTTPDRLLGVNILHAQGVNDTVMPRELMASTWEYLHERSGASLEVYRTSGGHVLAPEVVAALSPWLERVLNC